MINPNCNPEVTGRLAEASRQFTTSGFEVDVVGADTGPFAIETLADKSAAVPQVVDLVNKGVTQGYQGYVLGCFDDIGVVEARSLTPAPVISLAEAALRAAAGSTEQFAVVTTARSAVPLIEELAETYGYADRCSVIATGFGVTQTAARTPEAMSALERAIQDCLTQGAEAVVLGSAAYCGLTDELAERTGAPIIDGFAFGIGHCISVLSPKPKN